MLPRRLSLAAARPAPPPLPPSALRRRRRRPAPSAAKADTARPMSDAKRRKTASGTAGAATAHRYPGGRTPGVRRVLVTGAHGKVGVRVVQTFGESTDGEPWQVVATDVARGVFDTPGVADPWNYQQADLCDAGEVFSMVARFQPDAVVHIAAIPDIEHNAPHTVFTNNITATFNVVEACVSLGVRRLVNISSEQAPGFFSNHGPPAGAVCTPEYCPVDEEHPVRPNNPCTCRGASHCLVWHCDPGPRLPVVLILTAHQSRDRSAVCCRRLAQQGIWRADL